MPDIVLATLNAKYIHSAFGLRYLLANLGPLRERALMTEFDINQRIVDIAERLLALNPAIIGLGIYIWNAAQCLELVRLLKRLRPQITLILGGPEVSHETANQAVCHLANYVITGEADLAFAQLAGQLLQGRRPATPVIAAVPPDLDQVALPYDFYTDEDIAHRLIYVEASRGCPFKCEFCLSALDVPVRQTPLPALLAQLDRLLARGARQLKFVDRTFNLHPANSRAILEFLLERHRPGLFFHFEIVPNHLPAALRDLIRKFPSGSLQFEAGVQTFNAEVAARIERRQDYGALEANLRFLRQETGVHLHTDLIVGLPGESLASLAAGFDRLIALRPQEIQVGLLKRLRGAPIARHDAEWGMIYNPHPPYEILQNDLLDFATLQRLRRFARYWDLVGNSGNFVETTPLFWTGQSLEDSLPKDGEPSDRGTARPGPVSPFAAFLRFSDWLFGRVRRTDSIALARLAEMLFCYLTQELQLDPTAAGEALSRDYQHGGRREKLGFLSTPPASTKPVSRQPAIPRRQSRHLE